MKMGELLPTSFSSHELCDYVGHELSNPLNGMLLSMELIEKYVETYPRARNDIGELLRLLKKETIRLVSILEELRSSGALSEIDLRPMSLAAEIRELLALQSGYYQQRRIRINQCVPLDLPPIMADRNKLRQALLNLCKNALEAMPNGGTLTFRSYASEKWLCLDIADTGNGIPEEMDVFEPAVTNKPQSSGLGLAIVREIVKRHWGRVSYTSELGKGTTFHLKFPIQAGPTLERPARTALAASAR
jgi:signal transduction histidine kinase